MLQKMMNKTFIIVIVLIAVAGAGYFILKEAPHFSTTYAPALEEQPAPAERLLGQSESAKQLSQQSALSEQSSSVGLTQLPDSINSQETSPTEESANKQSIVKYTDSGYLPAVLIVKKGATVIFKNQSSQSMWPASAFHPTHAVYSGTPLGEHCPDVGGVAFDACRGIQPGGSWSFTFTKSGNWKYHDHLNPFHTGTIVVE